MPSVESVKLALGDAAGTILVLMQEGDSGEGFANIEWSDEMFDAYEHVKKAIQSINRALDYE